MIVVYHAIFCLFFIQGVLLLHPGWVKTRMGESDVLFTTTESVDGMRAVIDTFDLHKSGNFYRFDGSVLPW